MAPVCLGKNIPYHALQSSAHSHDKMLSNVTAGE